MMYIIGISYNGNPTSQEEDKRLALEEKSTLEKIASQFRGTSSFANPLHPNFSFDEEKSLLKFRRSIILETKQGNLHYHEIDPVVRV